MSDSDDFGPLQANTPNIPRTITQSKLGSSHNRDAAEAGPSRAVAANDTSNKRRVVSLSLDEPWDEDEVQEVVAKKSKSQGGARGRRKQQKVEEVEDQLEDVDQDGDGDESTTNEVQEIDPPPTTKARGGSRKPASRSGGKPASSGVNGTAKANGLASAAAKVKGKQKAKPGPPSKTQRAARQDVEAMDVEAIEVPDDENEMEVEEMETVEVHEQEQANLARAINAAARSGRTGKPGKVLQPPPQKETEEMARLKEKLRQAEKHIEELRLQLQEMCQVRQSEPEKLLEQMEAQHKAELQARDGLVKELMAKFAKKDSVTHIRKTFAILTRDEADKETRALHQEIKVHKDVIRQRDQTVKQQEEEIKALRADMEMANRELKAEIERGNALAAAQQRQLVSSSRTRTGGVLGSAEDPKISTIVSFYEDLTNVIVPQMKNHPGKYLGTDEWILNCVYTHKDVVNKDANPTPKTINFNIRLCDELKPDASEPVVSKDQLAPSVHYIPLGLQNESAEFVESLGFLGDTFTFERDQLSLFVRTLHDYISGDKADETAADDDDDDSVQIVDVE